MTTYQVYVGPLHSNGAEETTSNHLKQARGGARFLEAIIDSMGLGGRKIVFRKIDGKTFQTLGTAEVY